MAFSDLAQAPAAVAMDGLTIQRQGIAPAVPSFETSAPHPGELMAAQQMMVDAIFGTAGTGIQ